MRAFPSATAPQQARSAGAGLTLTRRDLEIAYWLCRLGGASIQQIQRRFRLGRSQAYLRLKALKRHGLVGRCHLLAGEPPLYVGRGRTVRAIHYSHNHRLTELIVDLELKGRRVVSEVEIRQQRFDSRSLASGLSPAQIQIVAECSRVPDAVEVTDDGDLIAYEVELTSKGRARRERILSIYAASGYQSVAWIVPDPQLAALLTREIESMGLENFMKVVR